MIKFLDGMSVTAELRNNITASATTKIAVAFWGNQSVENLGLDSKGASATVVCNLRSGGTNPKAIRALIRAGVNVKQCDILHGKVYIFDKHVILGSSNASANGLSFQGVEQSGWHEANMITDDPTLRGDAENWFSKLEARCITDKDLDFAEEAYSTRRYSARTDLNVNVKQSLLRAIQADSLDFSDKRIYVCYYSEPRTKSGDAALRKAREKFGRADDDYIDGFEDWADLPNGADFICFYAYPHKIDFDGFWTMPKNRMNVRYRQATVALCYRLDSVYGYSKVGLRREWLKGVAKFKEVKKEKQGFLDIGTFASMYLCD